MSRDSENDDVDPETFVRENRKEILRIIHSCDDPLTRATAWAILDRNTPKPNLATLHEELDEVANEETRE